MAFEYNPDGKADYSYIKRRLFRDSCSNLRILLLHSLPSDSCGTFNFTVSFTGAFFICRFYDKDQLDLGFDTRLVS